jgi:hypothetical protein
MSRIRAHAWTLVFAAAGAAFAAAVPPPDRQIATAVQAAPEEFRAGATVLGFDATGTLKVLREGTNDLVCLADDPGREGIEVDCYAKSLEPFMKRGRELRAQGMPDEERTRLRWKEAEEGKLQLPAAPATLYVLTGTGIDAATGAILDPYRRYVVYMPGATSESTGLPTSPVAPGAPWIMFPGTPGAQIMINPPKPAAAPAPPGAGTKNR